MDRDKTPLQKIFGRKGLIVLFTILLFIPVFLLLFSANRSTEVLSISATKINYVFTKDKGKIYASVPSHGNFEIPEVDLETFQIFSGNRETAQIAIDKNNVYCGNKIVPDLNPSKIVHLGNNYFSDGFYTYFCDNRSERNKDLNPVVEVIQIIGHELFNTSKPQSSIYRVVKLPESTAPYQIMSDSNKISSGGRVYEKGEIIENANADKLYQIQKKYIGSSDSKSDIYAADENNVYYKTKKINLIPNEQLYSLEIDWVANQEYLINPLDGMIYLNEVEFEKSTAPYQLFSSHGYHVEHALFLSDSGIFYYDNISEKFERAGDNYFKNKNFKEIAPLIFFNGKEIIYLEQKSDLYKGWGKSRERSKSTVLYRLIESTNSNWEKVGDVTYKSGSVWKNGNKYFYFDRLGAGQTVGETIYRIKNQKTIDLLNADPRVSEILNLIQSGKLISVKKEEILRAESFSKSTLEKRLFSNIMWIFMPVVILLSLFFSSRNVKRS